MGNSREEGCIGSPSTRLLPMPGRVHEEMLNSVHC